MIRRRLAFAMPFVIVACGAKKPAIETPDDEEEEEEETDAPPPEPEPPPRTVVVERRAPAELVDELNPLTSDRTFEDVCRHAHCNPPPPYKKRKPNPVVPVVEHVSAMKREAEGGTRVRVPNVWLGDRSWRIAFVTNTENPTEIADSECRIVAMDYHELECITRLSPEELTVEGHARPVRLVPPEHLVRRIQSEIDHWEDPQRARVLRIIVVGSEVELTIGIGSERGIDKTWKLTAAKQAECTIVRVDKRLTICRAKLTPDQVNVEPYVSFKDPP
jgi:hypothetical protein